MKVVTDSSELTALCARLATCDFVAVDTEFMRETTFWPKLCLIQMAGGADEALVDAMAPGLDLKSFFDLMANERVLKVFHAARQDVEIVHHMAGVIPHPLFDSQIAAMVCGFGESVSYGMLVKKLLKHELDKTSRFTDWSRRPLSDKQLQYAIGDVTHLRDLFPMLQRQLAQSGRARWLDEEMAVLTDPATYEQHPELAWQRLKIRGKSRKAFAVMMELAEWREREAQAQDVPRRRVLKDEAIQDIGQQAPETEGELDSLRSLHRGFARSARGRAVLEAVARGGKRDMSTVPRIDRLEPLDSSEAAILDLLRVLLKSAAARHGVAPKLLATGDDLERIVRDDSADVAALKGWRRKMFGDDALRLKRGELALAIRDGQVTTVPDVKPAEPAEGASSGGADRLADDTGAGVYQAVARSRPEDA